MGLQLASVCRSCPHGRLNPGKLAWRYDCLVKMGLPFETKRGVPPGIFSAGEIWKLLKLLIWKAISSQHT